MGRVIYSESQKREFIQTAKEMGIAPAKRLLKYPGTYNTAVSWFAEFNEERPTIDSLMHAALELKQFYGDNEKKLAAQLLIDRLVEKLYDDKLDADDIYKLGNALNKAIQTFNLIEGKSTNITESRQKDGTDLAVMDMLNEAKAKSALKEQELNGLKP